MSAQQQINNIIEHLDNVSTKSRLLLVLPASAGDIFLATSLLRSLSELYPEYDIYFACLPQFMNILKNNPYLHRIIPYEPIMNDAMAMEGKGQWQGVFDICLQLNTLTQIHVSYHRNGKDRTTFFRKT